MPRTLLSLTALFCCLTPPAVAQDAPPAVDAAVPYFPLSDVLDPLQSDRLFQNARVGIQLVNTETGEEAYAYGADEDYVPASVMKIITAAVAFQTLGPAYRFSTAVLRDEETVLNADGGLEGDVYVWGGGDPTFVVEDMWRMARDLRLAGVNTIEGDLIFDATHFDDQTLIAGWRKKTDLVNGPAYFAPVSALSVNYNTTCLVVAAGPVAGEPARVQLETPTELVEIDAEKVVTGAEGSRPWMTIEREVDWERGSVTFTMEGSIPVDEAVPWRYYRTMPDPALHFADVFRKMLQAEGIRVKGRNLLGKAPKEGLVTLVSDRSEPLQILLTTMNKTSSNIIAEHVLKAVGAEARGLPGTSEKGLAVVRTYLTSLGIPEEEFNLVNGSGLSRQLRMRPTHITAVLLDMAANPKLSSEFLASLSVAGTDGTLRRRLRDDAHIARVRGKTGSVNGVYCLAGYIDGGDGQRYAFAFLVNDFKRSSRPVRNLQDRFAKAIIELPNDGTAESSP
ncbi:MAG: D-alanyl-D-alanine carboxypeptidase/D-alanyl-D-alanine-endopeptidase [Myxococcota bacterium]